MFHPGLQLLDLIHNHGMMYIYQLLVSAQGHQAVKPVLGILHGHDLIGDLAHLKLLFRICLTVVKPDAVRAKLMILGQDVRIG